MTNDWTKIYSGGNLIEVEILKGMLLDNEIDAVIINKRDSSYTTFGEVELYVTKDEAVRAINLIKINQEKPLND